MINEISALGFATVELGHDLRIDLVPGVRQAIAQDVVRVVSVHNYCPVPTGYTHGSPDLYSPCADDTLEREAAERNTRRSLEFAADVGAEWLVLHGGRIDMPDRTAELIHRAMQGERSGDAGYDKLRMRQMLDRERRAPPYLSRLKRFIETLAPDAERLGCRMALEIQPFWESVPTELELFDLLTELDTASVRYWHDIGHGQIRENLGFVNHRRWLERLEPFLAGMHVHDVAAPVNDHLAPGLGQLDFSTFAAIAGRTAHRVLEPHPRTAAADLTAGVCRLHNDWPTAAMSPDVSP